MLGNSSLTLQTVKGRVNTDYAFREPALGGSTVQVRIEEHPGVFDRNFLKVGSDGVLSVKELRWPLRQTGWHRGILTFVPLKRNESYLFF